MKFKPDYLEAWANRGSALDDLGRYEEAIASYDHALKFKPDDDLAWNGRGVALDNLGRLEEAITSYDKALTSTRGKFGQPGQIDLMRLLYWCKEERLLSILYP